MEKQELYIDILFNRLIYVKMISIAAGLLILLLLSTIIVLIRQDKNRRVFQENAADQTVATPILTSRVKKLENTEYS